MFQQVQKNSKNQLIDEINYHYESICTELGVTFIDNKRVTCDNYGNLIEQVFYDDVFYDDVFYDDVVS